jgi:urea transport system permease protein
MTSDILIMQAFNGLSQFTILVLMALGLSIAYGLMGVINMAHGELMAMGAYATYVTATIFENYFPGAFDQYIFFGIILAFIVTFVFGLLLEKTLIQALYKRPLDTLLATWGVSLFTQQLFRQIFGPKELSVPTVSWLNGAMNFGGDINLPINRIFIVSLAICVTFGVYLILFKTRWGLRIRAVTQNRAMADAAGIDSSRVDAFTFAFSCGLAGIAGSAFTMLASTSPVAGQQYLVDSFIVVVFGGVESLFGTVASSFLISQEQAIFEFLMSGSMAKALMLGIVITVLYFRPSGLFSTKVRH